MCGTCQNFPSNMRDKSYYIYYAVRSAVIRGLLWTLELTYTAVGCAARVHYYVICKAGPGWAQESCVAETRLG